MNEAMQNFESKYTKNNNHFFENNVTMLKVVANLLEVGDKFEH